MATRNLILSDRNVMTDIKNTGGTSASGIKIYRFKYITGYTDELVDGSSGDLPLYGTFQGAIADEVNEDFIVKHRDGDYIDYSMIDVEFKKI